MKANRSSRSGQQRALPARGNRGGREEYFFSAQSDLVMPLRDEADGSEDLQDGYADMAVGGVKALGNDLLQGESER